MNMDQPMQKRFEHFGPYILLRKLAAGGMAEVFLAVHRENLDRLLALKRILPEFSDNTDFISHFQKEAYIAKQLKHPHVVDVLDSGVERHQLYLTMEFIEGKSLADLLSILHKKGETFPVELVPTLALQVAAALNYAHTCLDQETGEPLHIVHSDLSPQNIMVGFNGQAKVIDFGIAR
ncbi:MAG: serine/threonine protein kinase, partial [Bdellovibrionales bacterium]|nr:serine/threonine protein kinase [Bdellovibrionales bacterium]